MSDNTDDSTRHVLDAIDGALAWEPWNDPMRFSWETEAMSWSPTELATADERREQAAPADDSGGYDPDDQGSTVYMARDVLEALLAEGDAVPLRETVTRLREAGWAAWHRHGPRDVYSLAEQVDEWPGDYSDAAAGLDFAAVFRDAVRVPLDPSVRFPAPPWVSVAPVGTPPGSPGWRVLGYLDPDSIRFSDFREAMDNVGELVTRTVRGFTVQFRAVGDRVRTMIESIMPVDRHVPRPQPPADAGHTGPATTPFRHHGTKAVYPRRETRRATRTRRRTNARH